MCYTLGKFSSRFSRPATANAPSQTPLWFLQLLSAVELCCGRPDGGCNEIKEHDSIN